MEDVQNEFVTVEEFALIFRLSAVQVRNYIRQGLIDHRKFSARAIRIPAGEVERIRQNGLGAEAAEAPA